MPTVSIPYNTGRAPPDARAKPRSDTGKSLSALGFLDKFGAWRDDCLQIDRRVPGAHDWNFEMNESDRTNPPKGLQGQGPHAVEERRRILRSLCAGGAVAGLPSLAGATSGRPYCKKDSKNYHATASAVGSMVGSMTGTTPPKYGHPCGHYHTDTNWGSGWTNGHGRALTWDLCGRDHTGTRLRFYLAFELPNPGSGSTYRYCENILRDTSNPVEAVWLTALLNANKVGTLFPYTPAQVVALYKNTHPFTGSTSDPLLRDKAVMLFRDYLSSGNPG
jgi:hypothetical protein